MGTLENYLKVQFQNNEEIIAYVNFALEQYFIDSNKELLWITLKEAINVKGGITKVSKEAYLHRQNVYKILANKSNPSFETIGALFRGLGLQLKVESVEPSDRS